MGGFDILSDRGFFYQLTDENEIRERLNGGPLTFYIGFDPTADSLHVGHLLPIMAARFLGSAFAAGPALLILLCLIVRKVS